jgi:hypothetical protein
VGDFCPACGERRLARDELTLRAQAAQLLGGLFSVDGRLLASFAALVARPGFLAVEYCRGARVRWMRPVQIFLVANLAYFLLQPLTGFNTFRSTLALQLERQPYSAMLRPLVEASLARRGLERSEFAEAFDRTADGLARSLVVVLVPALALAMRAFGRGRGRVFVEHLVLATHFVAFQLVFVYVLFYGLVALLARAGLVAFDEERSGFATLALLALWLTFAWRRFLGVAWPRAVASAMALALLHFPLVVAYRYLLFWASFWAT